MPTISAQARQPEPHHAREIAESFGADPARYDRSRPRYPDALIERIVAAAPGRDVLDVGAGTGIVMRQLAAAGCGVVGVEVDPRMARWARADGLDVEVAAFEAWEPEARRFDAVVSGQTWHWIDPVAGAAKAADVLRPGGRLAVFWNVGELPADVAEPFSDVYRRVLPDMPMFARTMPGIEAYSALLDKAADGMRHVEALGEPEHWRFDWECAYTRDEWLDQVPTFGGHSRFPPATLAALLNGLGAVIDAVGGAFTMRYAAVTVTAAR